MLYGLQMDIVTDHLNKNDKKMENYSGWSLRCKLSPRPSWSGFINLTLTRTAPCTVGINIHWAEPGVKYYVILTNNTKYNLTKSTRVLCLPYLCWKCLIGSWDNDNRFNLVDDGWHFGKQSKPTIANLCKQVPSLWHNCNVHLLN